MSILKISRDDIISKINLDKVEWVNRYSTNCYAYALGLDIPQSDICSCAYAPGVMSESDIFLPDYRVFTYDMFYENLLNDFNFLGIDYRDINPGDVIDYNEWKIALFVSYVYFSKKDKIDDYHFLRLNSDGTWYHKNGFEGIISNRDRYGKVIVDPSKSLLKGRDYVKTLALKLH